MKVVLILCLILSACATAPEEKNTRECPKPEVPAPEPQPEPEPEPETETNGEQVCIDWIKWLGIQMLIENTTADLQTCMCNKFKLEARLPMSEEEKLILWNSCTPIEPDL